MTTVTDDRAAIEAIEALREQWAPLFNAKRIDELCDLFYSEDSVAIPPDHDLVRGRPAIRDLLQGYADLGDVAFDLGVAETHASGDTGYLVGTYVFYDRTGEAEVTAEGRTLETYRREPDGTWKCTADMWHDLDPTVIGH